MATSPVVRTAAAALGRPCRRRCRRRPIRTAPSVAVRPSRSRRRGPAAAPFDGVRRRWSNADSGSRSRISPWSMTTPRGEAHGQDSSTGGARSRPCRALMTDRASQWCESPRCPQTRGAPSCAGPCRPSNVTVFLSWSERRGSRSLIDGRMRSKDGRCVASRYYEHECTGLAQVGLQQRRNS